MEAQATNLASYVEAYEEEYARTGQADLARFLPPPGHPLRLMVLRELVRIDLEHGWLMGRPTGLDEYRARFPELFNEASAVREILFEEYRLRLQAAQVSTKRRGASAGRVGTTGSPDVEVAWPRPGDVFEGFRLVAELGRGAFGRVFLAEQAGLANRPVVLKIATDLFSESQALAQLQHTHIVPIHSTHSRGHLQAVCMPCLGFITLADILSRCRARGYLPTSGDELLRLATQMRTTKGIGPGAVALPETVGAHPLRDGSHVEASLWLIARLAEGLAHAHARGIIHRDLKPANILLTDDAEPMLLDFNLAADVKKQASAAQVGGTLPYMAPEQLEAFQGAPITLDARADVFALGAVLYELLTCRLPYPVTPGSTDEVVTAQLAARRAGPPDPGRYHPGLDASVRLIVRRCLEPDRTQRYADARAVQEDIERHLRHQPLVHTPESCKIRVRKWMRRHPRLLSDGGLVAAALTLVVALGGLASTRGRQLADFEARAAVQRFRQQAPEVELLCLSGSPSDPVHLDVCERRCRELLATLDRQRDHLARVLPPGEYGSIREQVGHLLLLWARVRSLRPGAGREHLQAALELNGRAGHFLGEASVAASARRGSRSHLRQRGELLRRLGRTTEAAEVERLAEGVPCRGPRELALHAAEYRQRGEPTAALAVLERALVDCPGDVWLWFDRGLCLEARGEDAQAIAAYSTCLALLPQALPARFRRGVCHLRRQEHAQALADLDPVVRGQPDLIEARINRALARAGLNRLRDAIADLDAALASGAVYTRIYFLRAALRERLGNSAGARLDRAEGLNRQPIDELSWVTRALERMARDPSAALEDLNEALALNPRSRDALQNRAHILAERLDRAEEAVQTLTRLLALGDDLLVRSARGVLLARLGRRDQAHAEIRACLTRRASPAVLYRAGCVYALTSASHIQDRDEAIGYLDAALRLGYGHDVLPADRDLLALREVPAFRALRERALLHSAHSPRGAR